MPSLKKSALTTLFSLALATSACAQSPAGDLVTGQPIESAMGPFRVVTVAGELENPWAMAFLPNGDLLVTERPGRIRIIRGGVLLPDSVAGVPAVHAQGQGGLLDLVPHPDFANNRLLYLTYSKPTPDGPTTALARARFENDALTGFEDLFVAKTRGRGHYGSRIAFDGQGHVFITVGDRQANPNEDQEHHPAQDLSNHHGTVIRLNEDGSVPTDNPFVGTTGALPEIWSYGHRNPQGLFYDAVTGTLWANEHGPQGGDELNRVEPGRNYGWPVIGYGVNYGGSNLHSAREREGMEQPVHYWVPSIATSGMLLYTGDAFPDWKGNLFVGGLAGAQLARLSMQGGAVIAEETLLKGLGRIRDVRQGPDGFIYLAIDAAGGPQSIVRLEPAN